MIKILIDTSPLSNANFIRGIGTYTRFLTAELEKKRSILVQRSSVKEKNNFKPDIIHYPFFDLFFSTLPLRKKAKTIVTVHDVIPLKFPKHFKPGKKGKLRFLKQKAALKRADAIITDSKASKNDIEKHLSIKSDKIHVIPLAGNPFLRYANDQLINRVKKRLKLPKNYLLYVGDINYNKNIPQLIKTLKYLPKTIKLVCLGKNFTPHDVPEWRWIESQLALSDVADRVKFLPNILGDDYLTLSAIYSGSLAYIQPSLYEGFGLPVLEAMQCKTPVISSRNSSLIEVGGEHALFCDENAESFAKAVEEILDWSKTKRQKIVREAFKWSNSFLWKTTAEKTTQIYKSLVKSS